MTAKVLALCACCLALAGCGNQDNPVQTVVAHPVRGSALQPGTDGGRPIGRDKIPVTDRQRYVAFESRAANLTANDFELGGSSIASVAAPLAAVDNPWPSPFGDWLSDHPLTQAWQTQPTSYDVIV